MGKEIIGAFSVAIALLSGIIYLIQIYRRTIKPHMFSWLVWSILMAIGFAAQHVEKAGPGAWAMGAGAFIAFTVTGMSFFYGEKHITRGDWAAFIVALSAIPLWLATSNPLSAVIIVTLVDILAFYPTFRKSWIKPEEEGMLVFFMGGMQFFLSVAALENITLTTALYPVVITAMNMSLVLMLLYRRQELR